MGRPGDEGAAEWVNREQLDEGQAQDVAEDALHPDRSGFGDSSHGGKPNPAQIIPDDVPDVVDRMNEMVRSGRIDNDAYRGEPAMDDEEEILGEEDVDLDDALDEIEAGDDDPLGDWASEGDGEEDEDGNPY